MSDPTKPQFLDIREYRRKRVIDAARMLPLLGAAVLVFPLPFLFVDRVTATNATPLALYLFGVWLVLIVAAMILARLLPVSPSDG